MKSITVVFEDEDFEMLQKVKGDTSWREFILGLAKDKLGESEEGCK